MSLPEQRSLVLDNNSLERALLSLFHINVMNLIVNKVQLAKNFHIQPSEIDNMYMWEYEIFLKELNSIVKKENKEQQEERDKYKVGDYRKLANPNNAMKMANQSGMKMPSMPSAPSIRMPSSGSFKI
jgi:hypothetical protein